MTLVGRGLPDTARAFKRDRATAAASIAATRNDAPATNLQAGYPGSCSLEMPQATLAFHDKQVLADGAIVELKIWRVLQAVVGSQHGLKYSLFYGYPGRRLVGYDNERGKGDRRHLEGEESPYRFTTIEQLIEDFLADVRPVRSRA
jgi:hypothetical protein